MPCLQHVALCDDSRCEAASHRRLADGLKTMAKTRTYAAAARPSVGTAPNCCMNPNVSELTQASMILPSAMR